MIRWQLHNSPPPNVWHNWQSCNILSHHRMLLNPTSRAFKVSASNSLSRCRRARPRSEVREKPSAGSPPAITGAGSRTTALLILPVRGTPVVAGLRYACTAKRLHRRRLSHARTHTQKTAHRRSICPNTDGVVCADRVTRC